MSFGKNRGGGGGVEGAGGILKSKEKIQSSLDAGVTVNWV